MDKKTIEDAFRPGGVVPTVREKLGEYDLLIADGGFSSPPHLRYQRFGIEPDEFRGGMFVTLWLIAKDDKIHIGRPIFMEPTEYDRQWRINAARKDAQRAFKRLRKH